MPDDLDIYRSAQALVRPAVYCGPAYVHHEKHMKTATPPTPGGPVVGLENIGKLFDRTRWTVRRWIDHEGFPAAQLPDGTWVTTHSLIDHWLLSRAEGEPEV